MYVGIPGEKTHGDKDYATVAEENSKIEDDIGLTLAKDSRLTALAANIKKKSKVADYADADQSIKTKVKVGVDKIGGARAYQENWGTLGGSVNAVMNKIEESPDSKAKYSVSSTGGHPYFPKDKKKPEFDKQATGSVKTGLAEDTAEKLKWQVVSQCGKMNGLSESLKATSHSVNYTILLTRYLMRTTEDMKGMLGALLDISLDAHSSGNDANRVQRGQNPETTDPKNPGNPNEDIWINDTVAAGKPIISGPSGHTLRYLNFWAEKRNAEAALGPGRLTGWPSLQAARLVMMADLMPPKHHSYDEIMTSSIGLKSAGSQSLEYFSKSTYDDLLLQGEPDANDIAKKAYFESKAFKVKTDWAFDREMRGKKAKPLADLTK